MHRRDTDRCTKVQSCGSEGVCVCVCLTESAVILSGAVHCAVGEDLQLEAGPAVQLPPAQDPFEVIEVRERAAPQSALDQPEALVQPGRRVGQRRAPERCETR